MAKAEVHEQDRPRLHPDLHADALELSWTAPSPPLRPGADVLVQLAFDSDPVRVDGIFISPGEFCHLPAADAKRLQKDGLLAWSRNIGDRATPPRGSRTA